MKIKINKKKLLKLIRKEIRKQAKKEFRKMCDIAAAIPTAGITIYKPFSPPQYEQTIN